MSESGSLPKLRFPKFRDAVEWEEKRLGEIVDVLSGFGFPERYQGKLTGAFPFYKVSDISNALASGSHFIEKSANYVDEVDLAELKAKTIPEGTTIFAKIGEAIRSNRRAITTTTCVIDNNTAGIKSKKDKANDRFVFYLFSNVDLIDHSGGVVPSVNKTTMENIPILAPKVPEQQKIADCLTSVDDLITAEAQMLETLSDHKKGLMQQLFPREGETTPRLRFPEFCDDGDWEMKPLGPNTIKVGSGITPRGGAKAYKKSGRPFVRSQNVGWGLLLLSDVAFIDEVTHASFSGTEVKENDVFLNISGASIGRSALADGRVSGGNVNQHVCIIRVKPTKLNAVFLNQYLNSSGGQNQIDSFQAGGNRQGLNFGQIRTFSIPTPKPLEQQAIANCLVSIDDLITAEAQKLEALKDHKKGLMQQLFPASDEVSG